MKTKGEKRAEQKHKALHGATGSMSAQHKRMQVNQNYAGVPKVLKARAAKKITVRIQKKKKG